MDIPVRSFSEKCTDCSSLVRCVVVHHKMNLAFIRGYAINLTQEVEEFLSAVACIAFANDLACRNIKSCEQRCCAMAFVIMAATLRLARRI